VGNRDGLRTRLRGYDTPMTETSTPRERPQDPAEGPDTTTPDENEPRERPQDPAEGADDAAD
jgi:hypothetical protein